MNDSDRIVKFFETEVPAMKLTKEWITAPKPDEALKMYHVLCDLICGTDCLDLPINRDLPESMQRVVMIKRLFELISVLFRDVYDSSEFTYSDLVVPQENRTRFFIGLLIDFYNFTLERQVDVDTATEEVERKHRDVDDARRFEQIALSREQIELEQSIKAQQKVQRETETRVRSAKHTMEEKERAGQAEVRSMNDKLGAEKAKKELIQQETTALESDLKDLAARRQKATEEQQKTHSHIQSQEKAIVELGLQFDAYVEELKTAEQVISEKVEAAEQTVKLTIERAKTHYEGFEIATPMNKTPKFKQPMLKQPMPKAPVLTMPKTPTPKTQTQFSFNATELMDGSKTPTATTPKTQHSYDSAEMDMS